MIAIDILRLFVLVVLLTAACIPLGRYMARVYSGSRTFLDPLLRPIQRAIYRLAGVRADEEHDWKWNATAMLVINAAGYAVLYALLRMQDVLPFNPQMLPRVAADTAFNTAVSFVSNTNWQSYTGETTMSYLSQMLGLTVQNFLSAATGMAVAVQFIRGLARHSTSLLGNFWVDLTRSILYILLPLSMCLTLVLVSQGVIQNFDAPVPVVTIEDVSTDGAIHAASGFVPMGPAASQIAIKQLGTNGGGFFSANAAHPFENPTPLSNLLQMLAILLLPAAFCFTFGSMVRDSRQGTALYIAMLVILLCASVGVLLTEEQGNPVFAGLGIEQTSSSIHCGGNMEGKEVRFGAGNSALWAVFTTAASNGSVNAMHDSFMPLGGGILMFLMQLGEVVFGGVGSGLYGMFVFVIVAVFVAGLLVGRTPEYLGHKIDAFDMKMSSLLILIMPITVLGLTALAVSCDAGRAAIFNAGPHGFSEVLYAFTSTGNNNGSAFAGLGANTPFYNISGGIAMLIGRYWLAVPALALAGSLASKQNTPPGQGTLPTHTPLFIGWLLAIVLLVGALNFIPALALGPIAEHFLLP